MFHAQNTRVNSNGPVGISHEIVSFLKTVVLGAHLLPTDKTVTEVCSDSFCPWLQPATIENATRAK